MTPLDGSTEGNAPAPHVGLLLAEVTAVQTVAAAALLVMPAMAPLVAASLGLEPSLIGVQVSLVYLAATLASPIAGGLVRRLGGSRTGQVAMLVTALGLGVEALGTAPAIAAGSIALGSAYGLLNPAAGHLLGRWTPRARRNLIFSIKQTGVPLGGIAAGLLAPPVAQAFGWRAMLAGVAAAALALAVLSQPRRGIWDADRDRDAAIWTSPLAGLRVVWGSVPLRALALAALCFAGVQVTVTTFLVAYLTSEVGMGLVAAGVLLATAQGSAFCGRIVWGWLADRLRAPLELLALLGGVTAAACVLVASLQAGWGPVAFALTAVLTGASAVGWTGIFQAEVARLSSAGSIGIATGGAMFFSFGGVLVAPGAFAGLYELVGTYRTTFLVLGLLGAAGGALALVARRRAAAAAAR
ncbi:MAG TPA: MFS transporter [Thermodesulfobacteriota bacterium]